MSEKQEKSRVPIAAAGVVALLVILALCTFQLRVTEVAITTVLGKPKVVTEPGLHFKLPWPIENVTRFDARRQLFTSSAGQTMTSDNISIIPQFFYVWRVKDPLLFFNSAGSIQQAQDEILQKMVASHQETIVRKKALSDFVSLDNGSKKLENVESELLGLIKDYALQEYGIEVQFVGIAQIGLSEVNSGSVLDRMRQEQTKLAAEIRSRGESKSKIMRDTAEADRATTVAEAEAEAKRIRGQAVIKAAEKYGEFEKNLKFAVFLRKLDALEETIKSDTTIILDTETEPYDLLKSKAIDE